MMNEASSTNPKRVSLNGLGSVWIVGESKQDSVPLLGTEPRLHAADDNVPLATVILTRQPLPDEIYISHLVSTVMLNLDLDLAPDSEILDAIAVELRKDTHTAAIRSGKTELVAADESILLSAQPDVTGRTALAGTIGGEYAYPVVEAILGASDIRITSEAHVVADPQTRRIKVTIWWIDLWEKLGGKGALANQIAFEDAVKALIELNRLEVISEPPAPTDQTALAVAQILWPFRFFLGNPTEPEIVQLGPQPDPEDKFTTAESKLVGRLVTIPGDVPLSTLIESTGRSTNDLVSLMIADDLSGELRPVKPVRRARIKRAGMVKPIAITGSNIVTSDAIIAAAVHRPLIATTVGLKPWIDIVIPSVQPPPGPLITNPLDDEWPDHKDGSLRWYAPLPVLVDAAANDATLFVLNSEGLTSEGEPALRAVISIPFDLQDPHPKKTGRRKAVGVRTLAVSLEIPFRDSADNNKPRRHRILGEIQEENGRRVAVFQVLNDWARIAYQALSNDNAEPAHLMIDYHFKGYERTNVKDPPYQVFGATLVRPGVVAGLMIDAKSLAVDHPTGRFQIDPARAKLGRPPKMLAGQFQTSTRKKKQLTRKTFSKAEIMAVQQSCVERPNAFVEQLDEGIGVIGCRPAFELGKITYRQFREVPSLRSDRYRVYQSQINAGQYLVVPVRYRIGRRPDDATERAYRPLAVLHAAVDVDPGNVRVLLEIGLQPDIRPIDRLELQMAVHGLDPRAQLIWPTEVPDTEAIFSWTAADTLAEELTTTALPNGTIHFSAGLDIPGWMVLRGVLAQSGLMGLARFKFSDGSIVDSTLEIDMRRIIGPWDSGPIQIDAANGQVTLGNPTASALSIALLAAYLADGTVESQAVNQVLSPGDEITVHWSPPDGSQLVTDHDLVVGDPVPIEEIRSFMEEVEVTVVVINQITPATEVIIEARIMGQDPLKRVPLASDQTAEEISFSLPLSMALEAPSITYRVERQSLPGPWRTHELSNSAFIVLTAEDVP